MSDNIEKYILKIPIIRLLIIIPQKIYLPKFKGLTLYDLLKTYFFGIIEGTFSSRAGSIAFSFFRMAAILQGIKKRALDGNASNPEKGLKMGEYVKIFAKSALDHLKV